MVALPPTSTFDPVRETARARIKMVERENGGKEFILPAARNFREKMQSTGFVVLVVAIFVFIVLFAREFISALPFAWARFLMANFFFIPVVVFGLVSGVLAIACGDIWLRSSRVIVWRGKLQVVTRWAFVTRKVSVDAEKIIQTKAANNTTINDTHYFDIEVRTLGEKPFWFYYYFPPKKDLDEIELKRIRTGGKAIRAMTGIEGKEEAKWILTELRAALGVSV